MARVIDKRFSPQPARPQVEGDEPLRGRRAVVIGGGTGAPVSIGALLSLGIEVSAVIAMADDGGSTGILRERAGATPPGDIRRCIISMAADQDSPFARAFNYRLDYAEDHALGNLILTALADVTDSFPEAIRICENIFGARGKVYPSTLSKITLDGVMRDGNAISGEAAIGSAPVAIRSVSLVPEDPEPYGPALAAIREADVIVLGPGSLFTSVIPNLLVPGFIEAIRDSAAKTIFVCSLGDMQGETAGMNCYDHLDALLAHGMEGLLDIALVHQGDPVHELVRPDSHIREGDVIRHVQVDEALLESMRGRVPQVIVRDMADSAQPTWHDPDKLRDVFRETLSECLSPQR